ncbi:MAG: ECF transporter S component [Chloroflexota bacterium]
MTAIPAKRSAPRIPLTLVVALVPAAAALNIVGQLINDTLKLPIYNDMIGTCVAAIVLGPWWGALVGVITNVGGAVLNGPVGIPFALANITGALVWGYGVRSLGMGRNHVTYFILSAVSGAAVAVVATPIVVFVFGGSTGHSTDALTAAFVQAGNDLLKSVLATSTISAVADKIIAGYVALAIIEALPANLVSGFRLPAQRGLRGVLAATVGVVIGIAIIAVWLLILAPKA